MTTTEMKRAPFVVSDAVEGAVDVYRQNLNRLKEEEQKLEALHRRHGELISRLDLATDAQIKAQEARVHAGIRFASGEFTEKDLAKAKETCELVDHALSEVHEPISAITDGIARIEKVLPELRNQVAQAERSVWRAAFAEHKEATPAEVIAWVERGYVLHRVLGFTGVSLNIPEIKPARLAVCEEELRRQFGLLPRKF